MKLLNDKRFKIAIVILILVTFTFVMLTSTVIEFNIIHRYVCHVPHCRVCKIITMAIFVMSIVNYIIFYLVLLKLKDVIKEKIGINNLCTVEDNTLIKLKVQMNN